MAARAKKIEKFCPALTVRTAGGFQTHFTGAQYHP
jgi:hypothetical protein